MAVPGENYDIDPGMARERTSLAWTRTAISFAAVGGVVLKRELIPGLILLCVAPAIWELGRLAYQRPVKLRMVTATIVAVSAIALVLSFTAGSGQGSAAALGHYETQLVGQHHRLHPVAQPQLHQDPAHMGLDRVLLHDEFPGDLEIGQPARHQAEHLEFPRGERAQLVRQARGSAGGQREP